MRYDWEATKLRSPKADKFYWCSVCGEPNNPFRYTDLEEFKRQIKINKCPKCIGKEDTLYEKVQRINDQIH